MKRSLLRPMAPIYLPSGWETVDAALSWIAFGSTLLRWEWDDHLFVGASNFMSRRELLQLMEQLSAAPGSLDAFLVEAPEPSVTLDKLPAQLREHVDYFASVLRRWHMRHSRDDTRHHSDDPHVYTRGAAAAIKRRMQRGFNADPRWDGYVDEELQALRNAESDLLSRIADRTIPAFGWTVVRNSISQEIIAARERIPPELCASPVSFSPNGDLLPCLHSDNHVSAVPLYTNILIAGQTLLAAWPNQEAIDKAALKGSVPFRRSGQGGNRLTQPVSKAVVMLGAKLGSEGLPKPGDGGQAKLERLFVEAVERSGGSISVGRARVHVRNAINAHREELTKDC